MKVHLEMDLDVEDGNELELSKLEHHIDWLMDFGSWSEIKAVYNVRAILCCEIEEDENENNRHCS